MSMETEQFTSVTMVVSWYYLQMIRRKFEYFTEGNYYFFSISLLFFNNFRLIRHHHHLNNNNTDLKVHILSQFVEKKMLLSPPLPLIIQ